MSHKGDKPSSPLVKRTVLPGEKKDIGSGPSNHLEARIYNARGGKDNPLGKTTAQNGPGDAAALATYIAGMSALLVSGFASNADAADNGAEKDRYSFNIRNASFDADNVNVGSSAIAMFHAVFVIA